MIFDTTGVGYFEAGSKVPELADLNLLLEKKKAPKGVKISRLEEVELAKAEAVYELSVAGLG